MHGPILNVSRWKHQKDTLELAKDLPSWGLFWEPGVGKTLGTIDILRHKMNAQRRFFRTLIFGPPIVLNQWRESWLKFSQIKPFDIVVLNGSGTERRKKFKKLAYKELAGEQIHTGRIFITNYESLLMKELFQEFVDWEPEAIVIDESHYVKSPQARRSRLLEFLANPDRQLRVKDSGGGNFATREELSKKAPYKYLLTGTPATNTPMDLFQQFLILDGGETFGTNFYVFRARFFLDKNAGMPQGRHFPDWQLRPGALEEINAKIFKKANVVRKEECLDLPPLIHETIKVSMSAEQARVYNDMKQELIAVVNDKACVATLAITKALRLQQMASGFIKTVDGDEIAIENNPKLDALSQLLETLAPSGKVIVWCAWRQNYAQIEAVCKKLGLGSATLVGGLSDSARMEEVSRFRTSQECQVLIANPQAAGMGVDLIEAPYAIYFSRTFSLIDAIQSRARNYRGGSEMHKKVVHYSLITEATIDELICTKLEAKEEMTLELLKTNLASL